MGALSQIKEMKNRGMQEDQIYQNLQEKGMSPREIQDAFNQEKIKDAVIAEEGEKYQEMPHEPIEETQMPEGEGSFYVPKTKDIENYKENYVPETQEQAYTPEQYEGEQYQGYANTGGYENTDTIIEIAEQVFNEQIRKIEKKLDSLSEFATLAQTKLTNNNERIKRIESVMDKLQIAILEKIGSYGKNIESTKKEMEMMQDSFSKILPELAKKHKKK